MNRWSRGVLFFISSGAAGKIPPLTGVFDSVLTVMRSWDCWVLPGDSEPRADLYWKSRWARKGPKSSIIGRQWTVRMLLRGYFPCFPSGVLLFIGHMCYIFVTTLNFRYLTLHSKRASSSPWKRIISLWSVCKCLKAILWVWTDSAKAKALALLEVELVPIPDTVYGPVAPPR